MSKHQVKNWIRKWRRLAIYIRDEFTCVYCSRNLKYALSAEISLDHLVPKCEGGSNHSSNLVTACHSCNSDRRDQDWREFCKSIWRQAYIESQTRLPINIELAKELVNDRKVA